MEADAMQSFLRRGSRIAYRRLCLELFLIQEYTAGVRDLCVEDLSF